MQMINTNKDHKTEIGTENPNGPESEGTDGGNVGTDVISPREGAFDDKVMNIQYYHLQWALRKRNISYKFNSYVVSTERESKNLQTELSHRIHSRPRQHVKSPIKAPIQWPPSQLLLRVHFLKRHHPKTCDRLRKRYAIDLAL
jgi:hypothetical protein